MPDIIKKKDIQKFEKNSKYIYNRHEYSFIFSEQHKLFNDNTQNILNDISTNRGESCYLNYIEKCNIKTEQIKI